MPDSTPNRQLAACLERLGWSPGRLARALNDILGPGYVARTTCADWVAKSRVPRDPLPAVTAHVLAEALGTEVPLHQLWGAGVPPSSSWARADDALPPPTAPGATVETATQWATHEGGDMNLDRRHFLAVSGAALTGPALTATVAPAVPQLDASAVRLRPGPVVTPATTAAIAATVEAVRRLDDVEGGDRSTLRHAHRQFVLVADYVRHSRYADAATRTRTIHLWGQLAQTAGWMAMDAGLDGLAQRYWRTALTAAHEAADPALVSHVLGCLTYQAIALGSYRDALDLANAGITAARHQAPAVRALAAARHAHAHAALGDVHGLRQSTQEAKRHLDHPDALASRPPWLYWLTDLSVVTGQSLITAAFAGPPGGSRRCADLLAEADPLITGWLGTHAERTEDRDALLHGTWLARSYLRRDDIDQTLRTATSLLRYAQTVRSAQVRTILSDLEGDLARRGDLRTHRGVLELRAALQDTAAA